MITGIVNCRLEAEVPLVLLGPDGGKLRVTAIIDTGFTGSLALPGQIVEQLGLEPCEAAVARLADGRRVTVERYLCPFEWAGQRREVIVHCLDSAPLIGMSLMRNNLLCIEAVPQGDVSVSPLSAPSPC